jgi:Rne/Rng family ribonuclease
MPKEMVISANPHETRVAILEEGQLCEYYVEREKEFALVGSIYKGRVTRVLPGMQSSFVDIGLDNDAFLYVTDFFEGIEEFEPIVSTVESKVRKMEEEGGHMYAAPGAAAPAIEPPDVESTPPVPSALPEAPQEALAAEERPSATAPLAPSTTPPPASTPGRFEGRQRNGRDFGRRGGRGRFGRRGGRGGDRRYGRELPPSKYASPRPYEERPTESSPPEGYVPIILPGESLAKYKDKASFAAAPIAPAEETPAASAPVSESTAVPEPSEPIREAAAPRAPESMPEQRASAPSAFPAAPPLGLEPLPGETLAKWRRPEPPAEECAESAAPPAVPERKEAKETREVYEVEGAHHEPPAAELSEDEAAALAEHVAEAQSEEAAREENRGEFTAVGRAPESIAADSEVSETEEEEREIAEEEAEAEAEGMIAPPADFEHEPESIATESAPPQDEQPSTARVRDDFRARMQHPARRGRRDDRGRRPHQGHGGHHRAQPRRPQLIADLLKQGQEIIVQIAKEPLGKKGARITSHIALPGRYLVYMPTLDHSGVSRKIASAEDRARLRHLVNEAKGSAGGGFIVRTAAATAAPEEVRADAEFLTRTWSEIKSRSEQRKAPSLLHRDLNLVERILRDYMSSDFTAIWVDSEEEYAKVVDFMSRFQPGLVNRVKLYTKETPVFEEFGIQQEIDKGLRPKVWLKSGGYIVINHTEALVAIDVNTGKFVGKGSTRLEDTIVRTNLEAVQEIVRQMRLRDLGGIIVIDFIDMEERRNRDKVMAALEDALRADRAPSKVLRFNEFGLVAITRKRTKQALERSLCQPCPYCIGSGMVKSIPTLCYEIQTEARKMAPEIDSGSLTLRVHPEISKALKTRESSLMEELERWTKKSIIIQADPTLHWEQYDIY